MARKNNRSSIPRRCVIEPLEARRQMTATLVNSFGTNGQVIGFSHAANTTDTLIPYGNGGIFQFTGGSSLTRRLPNGALDKRFAGSGSIEIAGRNPIEDIAAAPDGSVYVEYGLIERGSTSVTGVGFQHFLKSGRLDPHFGSHRLLNIATYDRSAITIRPGPIAVSSEGRLYWEGASSLFFIPDDGNIAGIRRTDSNAGGTRILTGPGGSIFVLGNGVTQYNTNFQRAGFFGINGAAIPGDTVLEGAVDPSGRLVLTVAGASSTAVTQLVRLNTRGTLDNSFGDHGSVVLPSGFPSAGVANTGSHLVVQADGTVIVSGGLTTTTTTTTGTTTTTTTQAALLAYDRHGRLIDRAFSSSSNGGLTASGGTLEGVEVDVAAGRDGNIILSTVIDRTSSSGKKSSSDFLEELTGV